MITIALAGNPNSGKSTLFNNLTGSNQYVGNWPGVTVEKKTGKYRKDHEISFTDLPGIYSLSPYTLEEVVSRDYLLDENPDVIIDVVDASNIERNLYLATQLNELGIPLVIALNMMDVVEKNGDKIDVKAIEKDLGCKVVEISALKNKNINELIDVAKSAAGTKPNVMKTFPQEIEDYLLEIEEFESLKDNKSKRWIAIKLFEEDEKIQEKFYLCPEEDKRLGEILKEVQEKYDDDGEGIITDKRYDFVTKITKDSVKKGRSGLTTSDKIDRIVTNRFLALPIFALVMVAAYYVAINIVGGPVTDWVNDVFFTEWIGEGVRGLLENAGVVEWLISLVVDGIIAGVGAVLGFLPVIVTLFLFIAILEDIGYMSRIAFILDRIFRRFGLSGKSFIPILMGTGCSVPAIMGTRTIENDNDRRMTIMTASFMPCGAKTDIIALFAAFIGGVWWYAPIWYLGGMAAVIVSGIILKKTKYFHGDPAPFVMELPEYHAPSAYNVFKATWNRAKAFVIKAGTIILLCTIVVWVLQNISVKGEFVNFESDSTETVLAWIGNRLSFIFKPLGFGDWMSTVATILGLVAKEVVVGTYGVVAGLGGDLEAGDVALNQFIAQQFTSVSAFSFVFFNQLTVPCFAATGAIKEEMGTKKWFLIAVCYQLVFSYTVALMIYQFGRVLVLHEPFGVGTVIALIVLAAYIYLLARPDKYDPARLRKKAERAVNA